MTATAREDMPLDEVKRRYDQDGFVILRGYLDADEVAELRARAEPVARKLLAERAPSGSFSNIAKELQKHSPWFAKRLQAGRHVPLVKALIGDELVPATAAWFDRPSGCEEEVAPHIDGIGRDRNPSLGATIWFALDAADTDNGCLHYGPGTHLVEHPTGIPIPGFDTRNATAATVAAGDAVLHNALTVHWSGANLSQRPRRAVSFFYWGATGYAKEMAKRKQKTGRTDEHFKEKQRWRK